MDEDARFGLMDCVHCCAKKTGFYKASEKFS